MYFCVLNYRKEPQIHPASPSCRKLQSDSRLKQLKLHRNNHHVITSTSCDVTNLQSAHHFKPGIIFCKSIKHENRVRPVQHAGGKTWTQTIQRDVMLQSQNQRRLSDEVLKDEVHQKQSALKEQSCIFTSKVWMFENKNVRMRRSVSEPSSRFVSNISNCLIVRSNSSCRI